MHEHIYIHAYIHTYIQVRDKERNTLVHAAARGGLPALGGDLMDMLGADAIGLQNAQGESALDVASGAGVGVALMRRVPAEVLRSMDMTRFPWLHQSLREKVVPLLLNDASVADIHLRFNHIGGEGAQALAEMLKVNTTVMTIDLTWNQIGAEGARALAEMLKVNTTVTTIDLGYNSIGVKGAEALAEMLKVTSTVITIDLGGNDIGA